MREFVHGAQQWTIHSSKRQNQKAPPLLKGLDHNIGLLGGDRR